MRVISKSSPLIVLHNCGQLGILQRLFGEVLIPDAVYQEVVHNTKNRQQGEAIAWLSPANSPTPEPPFPRHAKTRSQNRR
jgi:predicted nucleic acid-binding protein